MILGTGRLTWNGRERRSDRYGTVFLLASGDSTTPDFTITPLVIQPELLGVVGTLIARVIETRESTHIGDLFHGVFPITPNVGDLIILGEGALFIEAQSEGSCKWTAVGVKPLDGRSTLWLDIRALYRTHEQTVVLEFVPVVL
jgi:hypothetical protein